MTEENDEDDHLDVRSARNHVYFWVGLLVIGIFLTIVTDVLTMLGVCTTLALFFIEPR